MGRGAGGLGGGEAVKSGGDRDGAEGHQDLGKDEVWGRGRGRELKGWAGWQTGRPGRAGGGREMMGQREDGERASRLARR